MTASDPVLELRAIEKVYGLGDATLRVLKGIDLTVQAGEYVAIIGPSGSGKSTLLNLLGCLDRPTSGEYFLGGDDVSAFDDRRLSRVRNRRIGFVFQSFHLISHLTVHENVELPLFYSRMGRRARHERCREVLDRVGLAHRLDHLPSQLSGGERQRVAVARALSNDPALILADEPTGNLDTSTSAEIMELLRELHAAGRTLVVITHDAEIAAAAPRRVLLRDGIIESDESDGAVDAAMVRSRVAGAAASTKADAELEAGAARTSSTNAAEFGKQAAQFAQRKSLERSAAARRAAAPEAEAGAGGEGGAPGEDDQRPSGSSERAP